MRRGNCAFRGREDGDAVYNTIRPHASLGYKPPAPETGCATPTDSAGHAGATANLKLTFHLDHSAGADHVGGGDGPSAPSAGGVATRPANFVSAETRASGSAGTEDVTGSKGKGWAVLLLHQIPRSVSRMRGRVGSTSIFWRSLRTTMRTTT